MSGPFRCAVASETRADALAGTASTVRAFLLVENPGPWGVEALRDSRLPADVRAALAQEARAAGVRVLLVRRHHRGAPREHFRVFAAYADPSAPWAETTLLDRSGDLVGLDLAALAVGRSLGWEPHPEPVLCVCTHGRHDACCAERGRPVAAALTSIRPEETWECSHIGGDRFAGNLLVLPDGLYYGRLDAVAALTVAANHRAGRLTLDHLRGRSGLPMPVQAAEIALRRHLDEDRLDGVGHVRALREGGTTMARFTAGDAAYDVEVRSVTAGEPQRLTCRATADSPVPWHEVTRITPVS